MPVPAFDPTHFDDSAHGHNALENLSTPKVMPDEPDAKLQSMFEVGSKDVEAPKKPLHETPEERWARCAYRNPSRSKKQATEHSVKRPSILCAARVFLCLE